MNPNNSNSYTGCPRPPVHPFFRENEKSQSSEKKILLSKQTILHRMVLFLSRVTMQKILEIGWPCVVSRKIHMGRICFDHIFLFFAKNKNSFIFGFLSNFCFLRRQNSIQFKYSQNEISLKTFEQTMPRVCQTTAGNVVNIPQLAILRRGFSCRLPTPHTSRF